MSLERTEKNGKETGHLVTEPTFSSYISVFNYKLQLYKYILFLTIFHF